MDFGVLENRLGPWIGESERKRRNSRPRAATLPRSRFIKVKSLGALRAAKVLRFRRALETAAARTGDKGVFVRWFVRLSRRTLDARNSCPIRSTRHYRSLSAKDGSRAYVGNRSSGLSPPDPSIDSFSNPFESDGFISYLSRFVAKNRSFIYFFVSLERELFIRESRSQRVLPRYDPATRFQLNAPYRGKGAHAR